MTPGQLSAADRAIVDTLTPAMRIAALNVVDRLAAQGLAVQFNSGRRTAARQAALRERCEIVGCVAAQPGTSKHESGEAFDAEPFPKTDATWQVYGRAVEAEGLEWGGRYQDRPHAELPGRDQLVRSLRKQSFILAGIIAGATLLTRKVL